MALNERKLFIKEKDLCFACLQSGHISKRYKHRKRCKICHKNLPNIICLVIKRVKQSEGSVDQTSSAESKERKPIMSLSVNVSTVFQSELQTDKKCSIIVPVYLSHGENPNRKILVYALLDTQSDTTFVLEDTCKSLGVSGIGVKLSLSTMLAENRFVNSSKVSGLVDRGFNSQTKIPLPFAFNRGIMPAYRSHIPTPEMENQWPHLREIPLMP